MKHGTRIKASLLTFFCSTQHFLAFAGEVQPAASTQVWIWGTAAAVGLIVAVGWAFARSVLPRWKVPQRIAAGFAMVLVVLGGVGIAGYSGLRNASDHFSSFEDDARNTRVTAEINDQVMGMMILSKNFALYQNQADVAAYEKQRTELMGELDEAAKSIPEPARRQKIGEIRKQMQEHNALFQRLTQATNSAIRAEIEKSMDPIGEASDEAINSLLTQFAKEQDEAGPVLRGSIQETQMAILSVGCGALILGGFLAWIISRSIAGPLRSVAKSLAAGADQTTAAATQVARSSQQLAEGSSEQAASLEQIGASLEEMTSMLKRSSDFAQQAKRLAGETRSTAETGVASNQRLGESLQSIRSATAEMRTTVESINTAGNNVAKIIQTIESIAFQTNILALNAAVEAARAGEAGQGFAVVADEVRNLAQRSAVAARETSALIEAAVQQSSLGVVVNEKVLASMESVSAAAADVAKSFGEIVARVQEVDQQVAGIASASAEQATGVAQVNSALSQLDKVTQTTAANAEETASASEELNAQARSVKDSVLELEHLVGANSSLADQSVAAASAHAQTPSPRTAAPAAEGAPWPTRTASTSQAGTRFALRDSAKQF